MSSHFINLPPPPSDPVTPSEMGPGTPNSATTSMSELSTIAIKDGHRGHLSHSHHHQHAQGASPASERTLDAERADRISRLAGLERVTAARSSSLSSSTIPTSASAFHPPGYFDPTNPLPAGGGSSSLHSGAAHSVSLNPGLVKDRSTVGSASATGSVGGHTGGRSTWASGSGSATSDTTADKMSLGDEAADDGDRDRDIESGDDNGDAMSDEANASLVGFGEGASSTISGPTSARMSAAAAGVGTKAGDASMIDGMTYDAGVLDTVGRTPEPLGGGVGGGGRGEREREMQGVETTGATATETAGRIVRERLGDGGADGGVGVQVRASGGRAELGRFGWEGK